MTMHLTTFAMIVSACCAPVALVVFAFFVSGGL